MITIDLGEVALGVFGGFAIIFVLVMLTLIIATIYNVCNEIYNEIDDKIKSYLLKKHLIKIFKESENKYINFVAEEYGYKVVHFLDNHSSNLINKDKKILKKFSNIYYYECLSHCRYRNNHYVRTGDILLKDNEIFLVLENTNTKNTDFCCAECYCGYCILLDKQKNKNFIERFNRLKKYGTFNNEV